MATITYEKVVSIISKPYHLRPNNEINQLLPWFRKKSKLFQKLKTEILEDILRNCDFVSKKPDDIIILQGEQGHCFYLILRGKVTIYNLSKGDEENITPLTRDELESDRDQLERKQLGNFVCHLSTGDPFGEVALLSKDCIRTASVVADENVDLMVVEKLLYERSVQDVLTKEFQQKIAFICANPLFRDWSHKYRHQLAMAFYKVALTYNEVLITQGEPTSCIYFVLRGQLEILCNPQQHVLQYPKLALPKEVVVDTRSKDSKKEGFNSSSMFCYEDGRSKVRNLRSRNRKKTAKVLRLYYLGMNEMIGDTEVLMDLETYLQTVVSTERTELLVLEMKHYERLFVRRHQQTVSAMRHLLELKYSRRLLMHDFEHLVPLLPRLDDRLKELCKKRKGFMNQCKTDGSSDLEMDAVLTLSAMRGTIKSLKRVQSLFLHHHRPTVGMCLSESVFYLIRLREKRRQKSESLKNKYKEEEKWKSVQDGILARENRTKLDKETLEMSLGNSRVEQMKSEEEEEKCYEVQKLEESIRTWLQADNSTNLGKIPQLRRLDPQSMKCKPKPGYKMYLRPKKSDSVESNFYDLNETEKEEQQDEKEEEKAEELKLRKWKFLLN